MSGEQRYETAESQLHKSKPVMQVNQDIDQDVECRSDESQETSRENFIKQLEQSVIERGASKQMLDFELEGEDEANYQTSSEEGIEEQ